MAELVEVLLGVGASRHQWGWWWQSPDLPAPSITAQAGGDPPRAGWIITLTLEVRDG
jgi:hypothetical protein